MTRDYLAGLNEQQRHAVKHGVSQVPRQRFPGDDLVEHPANRGTTEISAFNAKANDPTGKYVHHHHDPMTAQEERFAAKQIDAPQAVLQMPMKLSQDGPSVPAPGR